MLRRADSPEPLAFDQKAPAKDHLNPYARGGSAKDVDTALLLGAGFPFFLGGITKHLDQTGVSERVAGRSLVSVR